MNLPAAETTPGAEKLSTSEGSASAEQMLNVLDKILAFANSKATSFYSEAGRAENLSYLYLNIFIFTALLLSALLAYVLTKDITKPLKRMMDVILRVENGEDAVRVETLGRTDEFGKVTVQFNSMLENLKTQKELKEIAWTLERHKMLELSRITLMSIGDAVISTDTSGRIVNMNATAEKLTGWTLQEAQGKHIEHIFVIINVKTRRKAENPLEKVLRQGIVVGLANHTMLLSRDGQEYHISDSAAPIIDQNGTLTGVVLVFRDISDEYKRQEEIAYLSFHDKLTGLYNRAFLEEEIKRMNTPRQMPLSIIMADINGLKLVNDAFGHHIGDKYLVAAAKVLKNCCRNEDVIARWGGDEFVVLLPKTTVEESQRICARISDACATIKGFHIKLSMALGSAVETEVRSDYQKMLKDAETNMYRHKLLESRSVRNAIVASLGSSLNEKNFSTEEHAASMVESCRETGIFLGMKDNLIDELELLAKLHDIGKIAINEAILMKPEGLDEEEWIDMKKHVEIGYRIANSIAELEHIAEGILSHHERWDGGGYPRGLPGESIPYAARIISVADAYDAMTRGRPYKKAVSHGEAVTELRCCAGSQFDPAVVDAFVMALEKRKNN